MGIVQCGFTGEAFFVGVCTGGRHHRHADDCAHTFPGMNLLSSEAPMALVCIAIILRLIPALPSPHCHTVAGICADYSAALAQSQAFWVPQ